MIYEVINPHDKCTFEAPDDETAALAVLVLGAGAYGAENADGDTVCGLGLFGFPENKAGITEANVAARLHERKLDVGTALDTFLCVSTEDRKALLASGGDLKKFSDAKRSSMTDMCGRAWNLAERIAEGNACFRAPTTGGEV